MTFIDKSGGVAYARSRLRFYVSCQSTRNPFPSSGHTNEAAATADVQRVRRVRRVRRVPRDSSRAFRAEFRY